MTADCLYPRFAEAALTEALADAPVVLIHGPRQCGKTTLAQQIASSKGYAYFSFDDAVALGAATTDPVGFVADLPEHCILDEVQRAPALFTAIKAAVDRARRPGRFLLTGSANVLLVPTDMATATPKHERRLVRSLSPHPSPRGGGGLRASLARRSR